MFLIRPRPLSDESFSSWRQRSGLANGFIYFPRPSGAGNTRDFDRIPKELEMAWLSDNYKIAEEQLNKLTINYWIQKFTSVEGEVYPRRWVLPHRNSLSESQSGPMACPDCLQSDLDPYFRLQWRFAFVTRCHVHGRLLIDRCPACSGPLWPVSRQAKKNGAWCSHLHCQFCGSSLSTSPGEKECGSEMPDLWKHVKNGYLPYDMPEVKSICEFMNGLWVFSQLLLRNQSAHIWNYLPPEYCFPSNTIDGFSKVKQIESLNVRERFYVIRGALWLLREWPQRFLQVCNEAKISRKDFVATRAHNPSWVTIVIDNYLTHRKKGWVTQHDVEKVIASIESSGNKVTKSAVRDTLGISESRAVDALLSQRKNADISEFLILCGAFEKELRMAQESRDQKATLIRDYLIVLLSVLMVRPIETICALNGPEIDKLIDFNLLGKKNDTARKVITDRARLLNIYYEESVRPRFHVGSSTENVWLLSRTGMAMAGHTVRDRLAKMIRKSLSKKLWNSADIFIHSLDSTLPNSRRGNRPPFCGSQLNLF